MEPGLHDSWSVKDLLAHLGWWEQRVVDIYDALLHNRTSDPALAETPIDELNRQALAENAARSWDEVQNNEKNSYHALVTLAETAPEADLFDPHRFAETEGRPFVNWILSNSCGHYDEHLSGLITWLDQTS